jgi:hypothetical protein
MELYIRGWEEKRSVLRFACSRHHPYTPKKDAPEARDTNTKRPHEGVHVACPFSIRVGYDGEINRWFVSAYMSGNMEHLGHCSVSHIPGRKSDLSLIDRDLIDQLFKTNIPTSNIAAILHERGSAVLSSSQINQLRNEVNVTGADEGSHPKTSAEKLLHFLGSQKDVTYLAIYGDFDTLSGRPVHQHLELPRKHTWMVRLSPGWLTPAQLT